MKKYPLNIITTYLAVSSIYISHDSSNVILFAVYGDMLTGEFHTIEIETNFTTLNDLLSELEERAEEAEIAISSSISNPTNENQIIDFSDRGELHFNNLIFSFTIIYEEGENGETVIPEEITYMLNGYVSRKGIIDDFFDYSIPIDKRELAKYHGKLLAIQYHLYLSFSGKIRKSYALAFSNLADPFMYTIAKNQYELIRINKEEL
jgi:hypothetical protein